MARKLNKHTGRETIIQEFELYKKNTEKTKKEKDEIELNTYANFCVNFVNSLKISLNLEEEIIEVEKNGEIFLQKAYQIDIPFVKKYKNAEYKKARNPLKPLNGSPTEGGVE